MKGENKNNMEITNRSKDEIKMNSPIQLTDKNGNKIEVKTFEPEIIKTL